MILGLRTVIYPAPDLAELVDRGDIDRDGQEERFEDTGRLGRVDVDDGAIGTVEVAQVLARHLVVVEERQAQPFGGHVLELPDHTQHAEP